MEGEKTKHKHALQTYLLTAAFLSTSLSACNPDSYGSTQRAEIPESDPIPALPKNDEGNSSHSISPEMPTSVPDWIENDSALELAQESIDLYTRRYNTAELYARPISEWVPGIGSIPIYRNQQDVPIVVSDGNKIYIDTSEAFRELTSNQLRYTILLGSSLASIYPSKMAFHNGEVKEYYGLMDPYSEDPHSGTMLNFALSHLLTMRLLDAKNDQIRYIEFMKMIHSESDYKEIAQLQLLFNDLFYLISNNREEVDNSTYFMSYMAKIFHNSDLPGFVHLISNNDVTVEDVYHLQQLISYHLRGQIDNEELIFALIDRYDLNGTNLPYRDDFSPNPNELDPFDQISA